MKRKTSILLILAGLLIASYPLLERLYTHVQQTRILAELDEPVPEGSTTTEQYEELQGLFEEDQRVEAVASDFDEKPGLDLDFSREIAEEKQLARNESALAVDGGDGEATRIIGSLSIDKINLRIPILYGATEANMKIGAGQIDGTSSIGTIGNAALAAHRSYTYGRFFNRLDEVEVGDQLIVEKAGKTYTYRVYKKHVVLPEDTSVLNRNDTHKVLTLVTCTPIRVASHRLIVHAVME